MKIILLLLIDEAERASEKVNTTTCALETFVALLFGETAVRTGVVNVSVLFTEGVISDVTVKSPSAKPEH